MFISRKIFVSFSIIFPFRNLRNSKEEELVTDVGPSEGHGRSLCEVLGLTAE